MRIILILFLIFHSFSASSQDNRRVDSLKIEIDKLKDKIVELESVIQTEILTNGYHLIAKKKYSFSVLKIRDKKYGKVLDTIREGDTIKIIDKQIGLYKVNYNGISGVIDESDLKVKYNSSLKLLKYEYLRSKSQKSSSSRRKSLNYSKPVKVKGHYRKTKSGKRVYVRPHTRKRKN